MTVEEENRILKEYEQQLKGCANYMIRRGAPERLFDDLLCVAREALWESLKKWDGVRSLWGYANKFIFGRMKDFLRSELPKGYRRRHLHDRPASPISLDDSMNAAYLHKGFDGADAKDYFEFLTRGMPRSDKLSLLCMDQPAWGKETLGLGYSMAYHIRNRAMARVLERAQQSHF